MSHWHCGTNIPGYMPEGDIDTYRTQTEAITWLHDTKESILDDDWDDRHPNRRTMIGNARHDLGYWYVNNHDPHDLGLHIWADMCNCEEGEQTLINPERAYT